MADRYWVGGTGTWDGTNTANWSATSGGAGGASVPTSFDNVFLNGSSGSGVITATLSPLQVLSFNATGFTGTFTGTSPSLNVYGGFVLGSGMTFSYPNAVQIRASSGTNTIQTNGKTLGEFGLIPGSTAIYNLSGSLNVTTNIQLTGDGTFNTNNNNISCGNQFNINGYSNSTVYNFGASTITCKTFQINTATSGTVNANSATVVMVGGTPYNVYLYGKTIGNLSCTANGNLILRTSGTVASLTYSSNSATAKQLVFYDNFTVTGALSVNATGSNYINFVSDTAGVQRTVSAGSVSLNTIYFQDIYASGGAIPWTGTGFINGGNNTNIKFPSGNGLFFGSNF